jgi:hypothetical protein
MARAPFLVALVTLAAACSTDETASRADGGVGTGGAATGASGSGGTSSGGAAANGGGATGGTSAGGTPSGGMGATSGGAAGSGRGGRGASPGAGGATAGGGGATPSGGGATPGGASSAGGSGHDGGQIDSDSGAPKLVDHYVTFYGWPDNDPAGNGIAYPKLHQGASGTGTYADPITFATDPKEWAPGTILYVPYLKRYVIMEDSCAACITDWKSGKYHIDLWLDSDGTNDNQVLACENTLTRAKTPVEMNPPADRPVISTPLFDLGAGKCNPP